MPSPSPPSSLLLDCCPPSSPDDRHSTPDAKLCEDDSNDSMGSIPSRELLGDCHGNVSADYSLSEECVEKEETKCFTGQGAREANQTKMVESAEERKEVKGEKNFKEEEKEEDGSIDILVMVESQPHPDPRDNRSVEANPPTTSHTLPGCDDVHQYDSSASPEDIQEATPTKDKKCGAREESFARVLRSAVRRSHMSGRVKEDQQLLVSLNLNMLKMSSIAGKTELLTSCWLGVKSLLSSIYIYIYSWFVRLIHWSKWRIISSRLQNSKHFC